MAAKVWPKLFHPVIYRSEGRNGHGRRWKAATEKILQAKSSLKSVVSSCTRVVSICAETITPKKNTRGKHEYCPVLQCKSLKTSWLLIGFAYLLIKS